MPQVYLSLGSNIEPLRHLRAAIATLRARYGKLQISSVYESPAVGFSGDNFYNLVLGLQTEESPQVLNRTLHFIEQQEGRARSAEKFSARTLDIDLILYDDLCLDAEGVRVPRQEILRYAFVLCPLAEIAPQLRHPQTGQTFAEIWATFDHAQQPIWKVTVSPNL